MTQSKKGNKEAKKPKQAPGAGKSAVPPVVAVAPLAQAHGQARKK